MNRFKNVNKVNFATAAIVSALGDVVRAIGNHDSRDTRHASILPPFEPMSTHKNGDCPGYLDISGYLKTVTVLDILDIWIS